MIRSFILGPVMRAINRLQGEIMAALDDLTNEVSEATSVMSSAATLISGLKTRLDEALTRLEQGDNGEALRALSADLDRSSNDLAAAVQANTPVETGGEAPAPAPSTESGDAGGDTLITPSGARVPRR